MRQETDLVLTVDLEDWFHCLEPDPNRWSGFERRAHIGTQRLLELLAPTESRATFFVLGDVALSQPELIERIIDSGHEVGSHGMQHRFVSRQTPDQFESDLVTSLTLLRKLGVDDCRAYRAPYFSISRNEFWALEILRKHGLRIDSSVFPIRNHRYGDPDAPVQPHEVMPGFWEWPITTFPSPLGNLPIGGGAYFRFTPVCLTNAAINRKLTNGDPCLLYIHPWEVDPDQPIFECESWFLKFRHYFGLSRTLNKLERVLEKQRSITLSEAVDRTMLRKATTK